MPDVNLSPYTIEAQDIERRRRMAELLGQQAMQPLETNQTAGGYVIPVSPFAGLAKLLQGYSSGVAQNKASSDMKALGERQKTEGVADIQKFMQALSGTPAQAPIAANEMDFNGTAAAPAVAGDRQKALAVALQSQNPMVAGAGGSILTEMLKTPEGAFAKISPHDYTPESVKLFMASGGKDFSALKPREEIVADNLGGRLSYRSKYGTAQVGSADKGMTPDAAANLAQKQFEWNNLSPAQKAQLQNEAARIGISAQQLFFDTNMVGGGAARIPQGTVGQPPMVPGMPPQMPPQAPQMPAQAPQAAPPAAAPAMLPQSVQPSVPRPVAPPAQVAPADGLTPALRAALAKDKALKDQDAARDLPKAQAFAKQAINNIDAMIGDLGRKLPKGVEPKAPHPGFEDVVGATWRPGTRFVPGTHASDFDARLEQIKGQAFLQAFESLKGAGQITEIEGKKATDALTRMSRAQSESEFVTAAREFQKQLNLGVELAAGKAGKPATYDGPDRRTSSGRIRVYNPQTGRIE